MQDEQTVSFQPMYDSFVPWYVRLFYLYLGIVILLTVFRAVRAAWLLRTDRSAARESAAFRVRRSQDFWEHLSIKTRSLRNLSHLTFLVSMIALLWGLADDLAQVAMQKSAGIGAIAGGLAETVRTFSAGVVVSAGLFGMAVLLERIIRKRQLGLAQSGTKAT